MRGGGGRVVGGVACRRGGGCESSQLQAAQARRGVVGEGEVRGRAQCVGEEGCDGVVAEARPRRVVVAVGHEEQLLVAGVRAVDLARVVGRDKGVALAGDDELRGGEGEGGWCGWGAAPWCAVVRRARERERARTAGTNARAASLTGDTSKMSMPVRRATLARTMRSAAPTTMPGTW